MGPTMGPPMGPPIEKQQGKGCRLPPTAIPCFDPQFHLCQSVYLVTVDSGFDGYSVKKSSGARSGNLGGHGHQLLTTSTSSANPLL
ncbi:hypothetical protein TKK_0013922 [Trichogramma kaykai]